MKPPLATMRSGGWIGLLALALPLVSNAATLTNRYSFTSDAHDSVGGQHGTLVDGASVANGRVELDGLSGYVNLPNDLVLNRTAVTVEAWITPASNPDWVRLWDFGNSNAGEDQTDFGVTHFMCALKPSLRATIYAGGTDSWVFSAPSLLLPEEVESHVVWTSDGATRRAQLYVNGVLVGRNSAAINTPAAMGPTFNNWLGRSQFSADAFLWGSFNEFRIWDGALSPLEVAASYAAGPDRVDTDAGPLTGLVLQVSSEMIAGNAQQAVVLASVTGLAQPVDIADQPGITYQSDTPDVLSADAYGRITAKAPGSATLTVQFGGRSDSATVQVGTEPVRLTHRYSFTADANDSIGTAHGSLEGAAFLDAGRVVLDGVGESHVQLPAGVLGDATALTIETWASFGPVATWSRLWHLGDQNDAGGARYFVELCPRGSAEDVFIGVSDSDPGGAHADSVARPGPLSEQENVHVAAVFNPLGGYHALYVNGALAGLNRNPTVLDLRRVQDVRNYIGRSLYAADPYLEGAVDEFRIYDGALSPLQMAVSAASGPNTPAQDPGTLQSIRLVVDSPLAVEGTQLPAVLATYERVADFNLTGNAIASVPGLTLTSSDPSVVSTQPGGVLRAEGPGTATITAAYQGKSSTARLTVTRPVALLKHRYSFTENAKDSVGSAHGALQGNATIASGKLVLDGSAGTYVDLPGGLVSRLPAVTVEFWADFRALPVWCRVFDFGNSVGNNGANFLFFSPRTGSPAHRFAIATSAGVVDLDSSGIFQNRSLHVVCVCDPGAGFFGIYTNGVLDRANSNARVPLSSVATNFSYIGRSLFAADGFLNADLDEFRIYEGRLYPDEIAASYRLGPNAAPGEQVTLGIRLAAGNDLLFAWPSSAVGYVLEFTPALGSAAAWNAVAASPATVGSEFQVRLPLTGSSGYYRLRR